MAITLTESAVNHVTRFLSEHDESVGLRLDVKVAGCSGFTYVVEPADEIADNDEVIEQSGCKVVIGPKALPFIDGMVLDYIQEGLNKRFSFQNPNVTGSCGCGESFTVGTETETVED